MRNPLVAVVFALGLSCIAAEHSGDSTVASFELRTNGSELTWSPVAGATKYHVFRDGSLMTTLDAGSLAYEGRAGCWQVVPAMEPPSGVVSNAECL